MIIVIVYGKEYHCNRAVKGTDYVRLYDTNGICIASFDGISSFDGYGITGGDWETV